MVDSWEAERLALLEGCEVTVEVVGLPGVTAEVVAVNVKHPWENRDGISLTPIYRRIDYATCALRRGKMLSFIPEVLALEGRSFATGEELHEAIKALEEALDKHWADCNEATLSDTTTVLAEASITVMGNPFKIQLHKVGETHKLYIIVGD